MSLAGMSLAGMSLASGKVTISAVVPNYNHGRLVGEAVSRLAGQVPPPDEIIVVDDCSTDDSIARLHSFARRYCTLRVLRNETRQGAIAALNRGLGEARGTYVYFGAADDLVEPGLFGAMLAALEAHPQAAFACCEARIIDRETGAMGCRPAVRPVHRAAYLSPAQVARTLRRADNWMITGTALVRREPALAAGGLDGELESFADGFLLRRLALRHGCCFAPRVGQTWRVSAAGYSRSVATDPGIGARVLAAAIGRMRRDPAFPFWYPDLFARRWRFGMGRLLLQSEQLDAAALCAVSARGRFGERVIRAAAAMGGRAGRLTILGWLMLRERPVSFIGLLTTALVRKFRSA
jgi:glycosyltransferase involved in cell wall biosynthesis